jgi:uncharacterized protein YeaO (DUF488 family)
MIRVKRVYESPEPGDGTRILVERLWPRGVRKDELALDAWLKEVAPSTGLRRWFGHDPARWEEFQRRYAAELSTQPDACDTIQRAADSGAVTLLFSARDVVHNNAVALKSFLEARKERSWPT